MRLEVKLVSRGSISNRPTMRLFLLTLLTMTAFAANSLLNRAGLAEGAIGPAGFAVIRVLSGAVMLWVLMGLGQKVAPKRATPDWISAGALATSLLGFSLAFRTQTNLAKTDSSG
ncbi:hypothetical protein [Aliiroseovarius sp. S253]|uniref:hypothetical protein n=1 Tax=Aliiroseovarius sp. S253 TaxID=3415133 RepID=UPI003C7D954A